MESRYCSRWFVYKKTRLVRYFTSIERRTLWCIIFVLAFFLTITAIVATRYDNNKYDASDFGNKVEQISALIGGYDCLSEPTHDERNYCEKRRELTVEWTTNLHNLAAQDTIATASRGLLWVGFLQVVAAFLTVTLLYWTVRQTKAILKETEITRIATQAALKETKRATNYELKPYLSVNFEGAKIGELYNGTDEIELIVKFSLINKGKTPANNIHISFQDKNASGVFFKKSENWDGKPIVFHSQNRKLETTLNSISGDSCEFFVFSHFLWKTDSEEWIAHVREFGPGFESDLNDPETDPAFVFWKIIFSGLEVRYKDLECEDTSRHKLLKGVIGAETRATAAAIYDWEYCLDSKHGHYNSLALTREIKREKGVL